MALSPSLRELHSLEEWLASERSRGTPLGQVELGVEARGREILRLAFQAHVRERGNGDVGPTIVFRPPGGGAPRVLLRQGKLRRLPYPTLFGRVQVDQTVYAATWGASICPVNAMLQLPNRAYSYPVQYRLTKHAVQTTFREAVDTVQEETGERVPVRSAEAILIDGSVDFDVFYEVRTKPPEALSGPILVASIDGKGIPMVKPGPAPRVVRRRKGEKPNKKKMATVGTVFTMRPRVRTPLQVVESLFRTEAKEEPRKEKHLGPENKRVWASLLSGKDVFVQSMVAEVDRRDPHQQKILVVVCDGERALQLRMGKALRRARVILDIIHALEKLWTASFIFHPEGSPEGQAWVRERALRILEGDVGQVVKGLRQMATKRRLRGVRRKTLLNVAAYLYWNRSRMRYDEYLAQGLPIASGSVEGACKNLVKARMERSGMRWTPAMAEAMLKMRALYLSGHLEEYWKFHIEQEQLRLQARRNWSIPAT